MLTPPLDSLGQDVRYAFRTFARNPKFTATAVFILMLGIGVNTIAFTLVNAVLLKPLPVSDPGNVVRIERWFNSGARGDVQYGFSYEEYRYFKAHARLLSIVAVGWPSRAVSGGDVLHAQPVSDDYFLALGIPPVLGRGFLPEEGLEPGTHPVAVISDRLWRRRFAADPLTVGRTLTMNDTSFTIIGVAAPEFRGTGNTHDLPDVWTPIAMQAQISPDPPWLDRRDIHRLQLLARPTQHASRAEAKTELNVLASQIDEHAETDASDKTRSITLQPATYFGGTDDWRFQAAIAVLFALVAVVLLVACANLANMLLARGMTRQKEIAIRLALGASRRRVFRQLLVESGCLGAIGGLAGLLLTAWTARALAPEVDRMARVIFNEPFVAPLTPDFRVLAFTALVSIVAGGLFGISPALQLATDDPGAALKNETGAFGHRLGRSRLRSWLLGVQVFVSMLFLVCAGLLVRGVMQAGTADPGFDTRHVFMLDMSFGKDPARAAQLQQRVLDRLNAGSGVEGAALVDRFPFTGTWSPPVVVDGLTKQISTRTLANYVSGRYFDTLGIPLLRGRTFTVPEAQAGAPIAIVSASAARRFWPDDDPIGRRVKIDLRFNRQFAEFEVVGVVADVRSANLSRVDPAYVYLPTRTTAVYNIVVRSGRDAAATRTAVRDVVRTVDGTFARSVSVTSIEDGSFLRTQLTTSQLLALVAGMLACLAVLLAAAGLYGVTAYYASQRTREIGIRMALGADAGDVRRLVMRQTIVPTLVGSTLGLLASMGVASVLRATLVSPSTPDLLFGIGAFDPITFLGVPSFLAAVAAVASYVPSRRASRVDPLVALRYE